MGEVAQALPRQLGFRRESVMHPQQRARTRRHSGAHLALFVEDRDARPAAGEMEREAASHHPGADHDYFRHGH